ncbi:branched-chain amino acid ABC transporter permease [Ramlibacter henchirensis]|uniref:Branched-chain amino acid ABC transporter permease n=1 Tax=Ramlibacter henchirensis TaxID=204072 RepID=A0A4Z0BWF8_9BURK|nr:branched-chain amino acid ABC transporter permease [Ramlibacter henchirensis]TFZ02578.1 branched-chain amino acid ABC transporter permease [Ramlibacter henchirensis]
MSRRELAALAAVLVLLALLPAVGNNYVLRVGTTMLMYAVLAMAWNFIGGFAGYPSFATAAFFGLGAYAGAIVQSKGLPAISAWIFAAGVSALVALLLGLAVLRLRGHAFAIATLVVVELLREIVNGWVSLTGGGMGINLPGAMTPEQGARYYFYAMLALAAITYCAMHAVAIRRLGFGLRCIKQNEDAASMVGVNTTVFKSLAFMLSAAFTAAAGAVYASWTAYIEPADVFDIMFSIKAIVMVLLGGAGTLLGPVLGAVAFLALDELVWRNFLTLHTGILGLLIILLILFLPMGLTTFSWRTALGSWRPAPGRRT